MPIINKIDLPSAQPEEVKHEIEEVIGLDTAGAPCISAKTGQGCDEVLEAIVTRIPPAQRRRRRAASGADLRRLLRQLPRRHLLCARQGGHGARRDADAPDGQRRGV